MIGAALIRSVFLICSVSLQMILSCSIAGSIKTDSHECIFTLPKDMVISCGKTEFLMNSSGKTVKDTLNSYYTNFTALWDTFLLVESDMNGSLSFTNSRLYDTLTGEKVMDAAGKLIYKDVSILIFRSTDVLSSDDLDSPTFYYFRRGAHKSSLIVFSVLPRFKCGTPDDLSYGLPDPQIDDRGITFSRRDKCGVFSVRRAWPK